MLKMLLICVMFISFCDKGYSFESCPTFTKEQEGILKLAYNKGLPQNLGYSLAGIVWQESFVGDMVITNNTDGGNNSFGITHIEVKTAKWLLGMEGEEFKWKFKAYIIPRLQNDHEFALDVALMKLHTLRRLPWELQIERYNGINPEYRETVKRKIMVLMDCYTFEPLYIDCVLEGKAWLEEEELSLKEQRKINEMVLNGNITTYLMR